MCWLVDTHHCFNAMVIDKEVIRNMVATKYILHSSSAVISLILSLFSYFFFGLEFSFLSLIKSYGTRRKHTDCDCLWPFLSFCFLLYSFSSFFFIAFLFLSLCTVSQSMQNSRITMIIWNTERSKERKT